MGEELYIEMPVDDMFPLLETANFLEIKGLVRLMVKSVANCKFKVKRLQTSVRPSEWTPQEMKNLMMKILT